MHHEKSHLRKMLRAKLRTMESAWRLTASMELASRITQLETWQAAKVIGLFAGRADEMETSLLWTAGKVFAYPKVVDGALRFLEVKELSELETGTFGLLEPFGEKRLMPDLILVPGVAFDANGGRLGRGQGFYDRWLAAHPGVVTLGVGFDFQIIAAVPMEGHDRRMDGVITENKLYRKFP